MIKDFMSLHPILSCHMAAFVLGTILDRMIGDPYGWPHPVIYIGKMIFRLEKVLYPHQEERGANTKASSRSFFLRGMILAILIILITASLTAILVLGAYGLHWILGLVIETVLTFQILAAKSLRVESMKVYDALTEGTLDQARYAVSMIVGRDTSALTHEGVAKAAVETVAENTSDGVIAPMIYLALGGPILAMTYKAINTMDSMIGYKNDRYEFFGTFAAKADDLVNYIPARISALLMILACDFCGREFDGKNAGRIFRRDRYNHKSPNSAQTESVCAGALGIQLAGDAYYFGKLVKKPTMGDARRAIEAEDIIRANRLMYRTEELTMAACLIVMGIVVYLL